MRNYDFIKQIKDFHKVIEKDSHGRYKSWEYCYSLFMNARDAKEKPNYDYLALSLAFYLASWGMYRGSAFLLNKDYKVHVPVVEIILNEKYDDLAGMKCADLGKKWDKINELANALNVCYKEIRGDKKSDKRKITQTLITKVMMGTLGCVPAYDRFFGEGVERQKVTTKNFKKESLEDLAEFYKNNIKELNKIKYRIEGDLFYPQMKILDMGFWEIGRKEDLKKKKQEEEEKKIEKEKKV